MNITNIVRKLWQSHDIVRIEFTCEVATRELEPAIDRGIREFVREREKEQSPVGCLRVVLADNLVNPVDSKESAFVRAASIAMTQAFEAYETVVDVITDT